MLIVARSRSMARDARITNSADHPNYEDYGLQARCTTRHPVADVLAGTRRVRWARELICQQRADDLVHAWWTFVSAE